MKIEYIFAAVATFSVLMPGSLTAQPSGFACPKAGTVVEYDRAGTNMTTWQGTDPDDPSICIRTNTRTGVKRQLYNWYLLGTGRDASEAKQPLQALFSHTVDQVTFVYQVKNWHMGNSQSKETWTRKGSEDITVGSRTIKADVLELEIEHLYGGLYHGTWRLLFDPISGVFLKGSFKGANGFSPDQAFQVYLLSGP